MSFATQALGSLETRLPKVISARTHGIIDYAHSAFFLTFGLLCLKKNRPAAVAALGTGAFVLVQSLLTDYPLGAKPVLSFEDHGKLDAGFAALSMGIPKMFGFAGSKAATVFLANTFVESTVVGLTDFNSRRAHEDKPAECGGVQEAVSDLVS